MFIKNTTYIQCNVHDKLQRLDDTWAVIATVIFNQKDCYVMLSTIC